MNDLQITYFLHLGRTLNVSESARQLFVSQPAISKQIAALEKELGFPLFHRTNRGVLLTENGQLLFDFFSRSTREYIQLITRIRGALHSASHRLRIGMLENLGMGEAHEAIDDLKAACPDLVVTLIQQDNGALMERLADGRLDLAITFDHALENRPGLAHIALFREQSMFVISRRHRRLGDKPVLTPGDLSGEIICVPPPWEGVYSDHYLHRLLTRLGIQPMGYLNTENLASGMTAVEINDAAALIDERVQLLHPERYRLIPSGVYQNVAAAYQASNSNRFIPLFVERLQQRLEHPSRIELPEDPCYNTISSQTPLENDTQH